MMRKITVPLAIVMFLLVGTQASLAGAAPRISVKNARRAITTYETRYWHKRDAHIVISSCQRRSPIQVTCTSTVKVGNSRTATVDWTTLLPHGVIRVHPGQFEVEIVLAS